jgi:hypothetical protein
MSINVPTTVPPPPVVTRRSSSDKDKGRSSSDKDKVRRKDHKTTKTDTARTEASKRGSRRRSKVLDKVETKKKSRKGGKDVAKYATFPPMPPPADDRMSEGFKSKMAATTAAEAAAEAGIRGLIQALRDGNGPLAGICSERVTTIALDVKWGTDNGQQSYVDAHLIPDMVNEERIQAYSMAAIGCLPTVGVNDFNEGKILTLHQDKAPKGSPANEFNSISTKWFANCGWHMTGPKSFNQFLGFAEYNRGLAQAMKQMPIKLLSFNIEMINFCFSFGDGVEVNRMQLRDNLKSDNATCNVKFDTDVHAAVIYTLSNLESDSSTFPTVMVFFLGYVIIIAKNFNVLLQAFEHVTRMVEPIIERKDEGSSSSSSDSD